MKIGDLVRVKDEHWAQKGEIGIILEAIFPESERNKKKAFRVLFAGGLVRPKLSRQLELLSESR